MLLTQCTHGFAGICLECVKECMMRDVRERVNDWAEMYYKEMAPEEGWTGPDEIAASINSYIEGNHLNKKI